MGRQGGVLASIHRELLILDRDDRFIDIVNFFAKGVFILLMLINIRLQIIKLWCASMCANMCVDVCVQLWRTVLDFCRGYVAAATEYTSTYMSAYRSTATCMNVCLHTLVYGMALHVSVVAALQRCNIALETAAASPPSLTHA